MTFRLLSIAVGAQANAVTAQMTIKIMDLLCFNGDGLQRYPKIHPIQRK